MGRNLYPFPSPPMWQISPLIHHCRDIYLSNISLQTWQIHWSQQIIIIIRHLYRKLETKNIDFIQFKITLNHNPLLYVCVYVYLCSCLHLFFFLFFSIQVFSRLSFIVCRYLTKSPFLFFRSIRARVYFEKADAIYSPIETSFETSL
jgi:hypothetical protein